MKKVRGGQTFELVSQGTSLNSKVYKFLLALKVGDSAIIDREDWKTSTPLTHTIYNVPSLKGKFKCSTLRDKSGWLIERIKA